MLQREDDLNSPTDNFPNILAIKQITCWKRPRQHKKNLKPLYRKKQTMRITQLWNILTVTFLLCNLCHGILTDNVIDFDGEKNRTVDLG